jgi:hypothetical protein
MRNRAWTVLLVLLLSGCVSRRQRERMPPAVSITQLNPSSVLAGRAFFPHPNGLSTLGVTGTNLTPQCRIRIGLQVLATDVRNSRTEATALVPDALHATPGKYLVFIDQPDGRLSNFLVFTVLAHTGPAPVIDAVYPTGTIARQDFNVQPGGGSAMGIRGSNFLPDCKILFGSKELETVYRDVNFLSAFVPPALYAAPGVIEVRVRNSDGKLSQPWPFLVSAQRQGGR